MFTAATTRPEPGDVSVCGGCGGLVVLEAGYTRRKATEQEAAEYRKDPKVQAAREAAMAMIQRRRAR